MLQIKSYWLPEAAKSAEGTLDMQQNSWNVTSLQLLGLAIRSWKQQLF